MAVNGPGIAFRGDDDGLKLDGGDGCTTVSTLKTIELFSLNEWIAWYVNYISIKLFFRN